MKAVRRTAVILTAITMLATAGGPLLAAPKVGVAAAVTNSVQGVQGGVARTLAPGSQVFELETVRTGEKSSTQLIFLDETSLSIGPKAQITLDRFVYDPSRNSGSVLLSASRGAFRFISGSQNPKNYSVKTPVATIGFRGTILDCIIAAKGLLCILQEGKALIEVAGKIFELNKPGQALSVGAGGVRGPFTPDGVFFDIAGTVFPLYGGEFEGFIDRLEVGDDPIDLLDELDVPDYPGEQCPPPNYC